ncbi:MAG: hypothetical protein ACOC0J_00475, partial [Myxococcota bacterium]
EDQDEQGAEVRPHGGRPRLRALDGGARKGPDDEYAPALHESDEGDEAELIEGHVGWTDDEELRGPGSQRGAACSDEKAGEEEVETGRPVRRVGHLRVIK